MKKFILCTILAVALCSCQFDPESTYSTYDTDLTIVEVQVNDTYVVFNITPDDPTCYYYCTILQKGTLEAKQIDDNQFMRHCIDSLYADYNKWKETQTADKYIADFGSYNLYYGKKTEQFFLLFPDCDYEILSFGIDPDKREPLGRLQRHPIRTKPIDPDYVSPMSIDFTVKVTKESNGLNSAEVVVRPSYQGKVWLDPYWCYIVSEQVLIEHFNNDPIAFLQDRIDAFLKGEPETLDHILTNVCTLYCEQDESKKSERYIVIAAPFFTTWREKVFTYTFSYDIDEDGAIQ